MKNFKVFYWSKKNNASFSGKGALSAKRWIWNEMEMDSIIATPRLNDSTEKNTVINRVDITKQSWADVQKPIYFSKDSELLPQISSLNRNVKGIILGSQVSHTFGTTYEAHDTLDKSMDTIKNDAIKGDMINDQTAVLWKTANSNY